MLPFSHQCLAIFQSVEFGEALNNPNRFKIVYFLIADFFPHLGMLFWDCIPKVETMDKTMLKRKY